MPLADPAVLLLITSEPATPHNPTHRGAQGHTGAFSGLQGRTGAHMGALCFVSASVLTGIRFQREALAYWQ